MGENNPGSRARATKVVVEIIETLGEIDDSFGAEGNHLILALAVAEKLRCQCALVVVQTLRLWQGNALSI